MRPLLLFLLLSARILQAQPTDGWPKHKQDTPRKTTSYQGAIIRVDAHEKRITLLFTGHEFADGAAVIRETLRKHRIKAAFFLTGDFYRNPAFAAVIKGLKKDGHYLGAHSDKHLLYADWGKRDSTLVTKAQFTQDLLANYAEMAKHGIKRKAAPYFLPPYEWYNPQIADWTSQLGLTLINHTPGTLSHADYTYPSLGKQYRSSEVILDSILSFEEKDPKGLNGFLLLLHLGTDPARTDKLYLHLDELVTQLKARGYQFVSLPEALQ
ncbi:polysaccharide deacetylase family protein [Rufibacter sediminis]|uniref:Polysaccharide deacetylase family protein n=1 Tax=Rufibacter sediminis TaxID=2762756 RepID=A0ABR6VMG5_9BACT|nr:polysaccharide deacetylase family protein [Rufibacter sediminis]MBC3538074.1 polysaccharide deacetylase family protein [Rufibacter sediminis]